MDPQGAPNGLPRSPRQGCQQPLRLGCQGSPGIPQDPPAGIDLTLTYCILTACSASPPLASAQLFSVCSVKSISNQNINSFLYFDCSKLHA